MMYFYIFATQTVRPQTYDFLIRVHYFHLHNVGFRKRAKFYGKVLANYHRISVKTCEKFSSVYASISVKTLCLFFQDFRRFRKFKSKF